MSRSYALNPEDGMPMQPSTITTPAPPNYATHVGGYEQQPPRAQSFPEVFHHNRNEEDIADPELTEEARVPVAHLNLEFKECFREHKSVRTYPQLMQFTEFLYKYTLIIVYHFFVFLFGVVFAFLFAIINAIMAFIHVWIYGPLLKLTLLWIYATAPLVVAPIRAMYRPLVDASARVFRQIRVDGKLNGSFAERLAGSRSGEAANV